MEIPFQEDICFPYRDKLITARFNNFISELKDCVFRCRRGGEQFSFAKRGLTKPFRKALNEQKIPSELRDNLLLLCRKDEVLWCEALGYSALGQELRQTAGLLIEIRTVNDHSKGNKNA